MLKIKNPTESPSPSVRQTTNFTAKTLQNTNKSNTQKKRFNFYVVKAQWTRCDQPETLKFDQVLAMETRFRSGFWVLIAVLLCISLSGFSVSAETRRPKNVQVALRAKWPGTPLLLEAGYDFYFFFKTFFLLCRFWLVWFIFLIRIVTY